MSILNTLATPINAFLAKFDMAILRRSQLNALRALSRSSGSSRPTPPLPANALDYLSSRNPRLTVLTEQYRHAVPEIMRPTRWTADYIDRNVDLGNFRAANAYVFGDRNVESTYVLTAYYIETLDSSRLLHTLGEDGLFGAPLFEYRHGAFVSRDLLDSIVEIYSLLTHIPASALQDGAVLDIGSGYGRFGYRLTQALPYIRCVYCTDAVPVSTFLCEYYLNYRNADRVVAVPFPDIEQVLETGNVTLAVNIHSFSECSLAAIEWWIRLVSKHRIRYLFLVPNPADHEGKRLLTQELDGTHKDYSQLLTSYGYEPIGIAPKYNDEVIQRLGVTPTCHHFYELS